MSYIINKTNGDFLVEIADGQIDENTTDISIVGRYVTSYGEKINENLIKLLENFANDVEPDTPMRGQLWYDSKEDRLKVYDGRNFKLLSGPIVSETLPGMVIGDIWIDPVNKGFYFFDGVDAVLVGPSKRIVLTLDITGFSDPDGVIPYNDVLQVLDALYPTDDLANGITALVYCTKPLAATAVEQRQIMTFTVVNGNWNYDAGDL